MVWDATGGSFSVNLRSYHYSLGILHAHTFAAFDTSKGPWGTQSTTHHCYLASATPFFHILDKGHLQLSRYLVGFITKKWAASMGISQVSSSLPSDTENSIQIRLTDAKSPPSILSASLCACLQRIQPHFSLSHLTARTSASCMESDSTLNPEIWVATTLPSLGTVAQTIHLLNAWEAYFREFPMWRTVAFFRLTTYVNFDQEEMKEFIMAFDWQRNSCMKNLLADEYSTALHQQSFLRTHVLLLSKGAPLSAHPGKQCLYFR
ncbi:uncharacterized protein Bfra_000441 [Botrytis fragariae]|uniref:Uncharacterized protein n=1 Tax=Botrytis fragariae TaxID=1964551 RepID=A0A8H6B333_9HELO|nr:uncharacterized protein Bfra_000441 [Botrytis fragariae]KAF5878275.1 hypothetical protein Bfra_000441 [Botrytis fragariae]